MISISFSCGCHVVRTSSLNDKHSCQIFRIGLRGPKSTPTSTTPLIRANMSCAVVTIFAFLSSSISMAKLSCLVTTIFSSLDFLSSSISMANMSSLVTAPFSSFANLFSSVSTANLIRLLATTFSSLSLLSNSFSSPCFNLLRVARHCFSWSLFLTTFSFPAVVFWFSFLIYFFPHLILSLSFLCSLSFLSSVLQSLKLCLL